MLPPQLRPALALAQRQSLTTLALKAGSTAILRGSLTHSRSCWSWRRRSDDWTSKLDPSYSRINMMRSFKTRAKLLKNLKRRGKFNWDFDSRPFFTPHLVRWASHWDGKARSRWFLNDEAKGGKDAEEGRAEETGKTTEDADGFELSPREKEWKEKMEAMRKRIEKDPYEALFGQRFEPFWSPLVPSWMREEMGLQGWPKKKETPKETPKAGTPAEAPKPEPTKTVKNETADRAKAMKPEPAKKEDVALDGKSKPDSSSTSAQPNSYSYASSTSWDSWTNRTRRVEWDSVSGVTRKYEYDPITNRMVQVEAPKPAPYESKGVEGATPTVTPKSASIEQAKLTDTETWSKAVRSTLDNSSKAVNVPVKQSSDLRKSIPIPPPLSQPSHSIPLPGLRTSITEFKPSNTSIGPVKTTAVSSTTIIKPAALAKLPEKEKEKEKETDLESLTAGDVRASMGRTKQPTTPPAKRSLTTAEEKMQIAIAGPAPLLERERDATRSRMHVQKNKQSQWDEAELSVMLDKELESLQKKKEKLEKDERGLFHIERQKRELKKLDERIKEVSERVGRMNEALSIPTSTKMGVNNEPAISKPLQSSLDRMQSKDLPSKATATTDLDDSAAHECTEPINSRTQIEALNGIPKNWTQQAELLQADRVRRSTSPNKRMYPAPGRWIDEMNARKAEYEKAQQRQQAEVDTPARSDASTKLEKANRLLEAEVAQHKARMLEHETRYAHKIRSLRGELETAYRQSSVHSEQHLERIRYLEEELARLTRAAEGTNSGKAGSASGAKAQKSEKEKEKEMQRLRDRELVKEVREIYEGRYGVIDASHRQPTEPKKDAKPAAITSGKQQVVEVESNVDLGEALAKYESEAAPAYTSSGTGRDLENEIARDEREYYQGPLFKTKIPQPPIDSLKDDAASGKKLVDDTMPRLIPTELAKPPAALSEAANEKLSTTTSHGISWADPPVYKVLAYDSGNDIMSTATTTSNFISSAENPIGISQALSQLYQPARFVPYFAELQKDGYQVIFGTTDLLVFKKVETREGVGAAIGDAEGKVVKASAADLPNPVDGTAKPAVRMETKTPTGNFASPTGFVNHDPVLPVEEKDAAAGLPDAQKKAELESSRSVKEQDEENDLPWSYEEGEDIEWRHYPRVRRMEQHFTGSRRRWNTNHRRHHGRRFEERDKDFNKRRKRGAVKWILGVGAGTAAVMYFVGAAAERARVGREEDWARKAEEQRRKWRGL